MLISKKTTLNWQLLLLKRTLKSGNNFGALLRNQTCCSRLWMHATPTFSIQQIWRNTFRRLIPRKNLFFALIKQIISAKNLLITGTLISTIKVSHTFLFLQRLNRKNLTRLKNQTIHQHQKKTKSLKTV